MMNVQKEEIPDGKTAISRVTGIHWLKLVVRSLVFIAALAVYLVNKEAVTDNLYRPTGGTAAYLLIVIWVLFVVEMIFRFFPSSLESLGSQKQFSRNFVPEEKFTTLTRSVKRKHLKSAVYVALLWIGLNAVIAVFYFAGIFDEAILLIISLFFGVCDLICILFYCPFQSLIMKNRCCVTCRIYNWDFLMMFTPMVLVRSYYTLSLFVIALLLFIRWEVTYYRHPEWFCEETNQKLGCTACTERLCRHNKSMRNSRLRGTKQPDQLLP